MDEVKRKVYLDLFASPLTLLPTVIGATALLGSWAIGGVSALTFGGIGAVLMGVGIFASRLIFGLDKLTERAYQYTQEHEQKSQLRSLQQLHRRLENDRDPRTERLLRQLWALYKDLKDAVETGKIKVAAHEVLDGVNQMFHVCVDHLDRSFELWKTSQKMVGASRDRVLEQREALIEEVAQSCDYLEQTIDSLHFETTQKNKSNLAQMRQELNETIRVAKKAEERTNTFMTEEAKTYDASEFE